MISAPKIARLAAVSILLVSAACARDKSVTPLTSSGEKSEVELPSQLLGLQVAQEDVSKAVAGVKHPDIDGLGLFSLREDELLRASLQVGTFTRAARSRTKNFRQAVVSQMGSRTPESVKVGDVTVHLTSGNQQNIFVWFNGRTFYVLSVHQQYPFPRTLLRRILELQEDQ